MELGDCQQRCPPYPFSPLLYMFVPATGPWRTLGQQLKGGILRYWLSKTAQRTLLCSFNWPPALESFEVEPSGSTCLVALRYAQSHIYASYRTNPIHRVFSRAQRPGYMPGTALGQDRFNRELQHALFKDADSLFRVTGRRFGKFFFGCLFLTMCPSLGLRRGQVCWSPRGVLGSAGICCPGRVQSDSCTCHASVL